MRIATWNVNSFNPARSADKLRLLELVDWDVALLQEVGVWAFEVFTSGSLCGVYAVELLGGAWDKHAHGVAILALYDQSRFHDAGADHGLRDVMVEHLMRNRPDLLERRLKLGVRPEDSALAVTYQRSSSNYPKVNRMDRIYVSSAFRVRDVETLYDEALTVGSEHALVVADVDLAI